MTRLIFLLLFTFASGDQVVQSNIGPIRGVSLDEKNVEAFLGIPFAEPPVGNLRFARPVPKSPWTEIYDTKQLPPACVQSLMEMTAKFLNDSFTMDEDCLYLNLWVPKTDSPLKPIMVFIHGGGLMTGTSSLKIYDGANLAQHGDVIVASMNYRVGTLGFFSAFTDEAAGSMGMYDQVLAMQWIKENAKVFGGDPDNIVIFGESAGAWSVSLHMVSPLSRNLFKRGIIQSGAAVHPTFSSNNDVLRMGSQMISKLVECASNDEELKENPKSVVECMKNLPAEKFLAADEVLLKKFAFLVPRVGDEFLPQSPIDSFRKGEFKDTEVLLGIARDEGSMFVAVQLGFESGDMFGEKIDPDTFDETTAEKLTQEFKKNKHFDKILHNYLQRAKEDNRYTHLDAVGDMMGDALITCSTAFHADFQSLKNNPVYFYVFDYRSASSFFPEWIGVTHFAEVPYVFGNPFLKAFSKYDEKLSKGLMDMWVAFARTGNPSIPGGLKWPKYTYENPKYLSISMKDKVGIRPDNYRCEDWRKVYQATIDEEVIQNFKLSSDCTRIISLLCNTHQCK